MIDQRAPGHPLRDRLVDTLGDAVFSNCQARPSHPLAQLWRQVKPNGYPDVVGSAHFPISSHILILVYPKGISPNFRPPAQEEADTPKSSTPVVEVEEPRTFLPQNIRVVAASSTPPSPDSYLYSFPRMRTTSTTPSPVTPPAARGGFASQFYPQFMFRSTPSDVPAAPATQSAPRQNDASFSHVRQAFTQAIAPVATSIVPQNTLRVRDHRYY